MEVFVYGDLATFAETCITKVLVEGTINIKRAVLG